MNDDILRNDETDKITADRREEKKDGKLGMTFAMVFVVLVFLVVGAYSLFV